MNKDIYNIVSDYFRGQVSDKDNTYLQEWIAESPENEEVYKELERVWKITGEPFAKLTPDVDAEWEQFVREKEKATNENIFKNEKSLNLRKYLKVAAMVIPAFLILSATLYYFNREKRTEELVIVTTTEKKKCILSDSSGVWVNCNSTFIYPATFEKNERVVELKGEAFFDVAKGEAPFIIKTRNTQITVMGTAFNIRAIEQEKFIEVVVNHGTVVFASTSSKKEIVLKAGEMGTFDEQTKLIKKGKVTNDNASGWKDEQLSFQDTPLIEIEEILARYFDINMQVDSSMKQCKFTGEFKHPKLEELLDVISLTLGSNYKIHNDTIFIKGQGCNN